MRKPVALLLIMAVIVAVAYFTKPSNTQCLAEAKTQFRQHMLNGATSTLPNNINRSVFDATLEKAYAGSIAIQDKILYKEIHQQKGNTKVNIGWAAFGIVHLSEP